MDFGYVIKNTMKNTCAIIQLRLFFLGSNRFELILCVQDPIYSDTLEYFPIYLEKYKRRAISRNVKSDHQMGFIQDPWNP